MFSADMTPAVQDPGGSIKPQYRVAMGPTMAGVSNGTPHDPGSMGASGLTRQKLPEVMAAHDKQPTIGGEASQTS